MESHNPALFQTTNQIPYCLQAHVFQCTGHNLEIPLLWLAGPIIPHRRMRVMRNEQGEWPPHQRTHHGRHADASSLRSQKFGQLIFQSAWWLTYPSEKSESQWEGLSMIIPYIMENNKCLKPPTSNTLTEVDCYFSL
jgi:hypothetical protein